MSDDKGIPWLVWAIVPIIVALIGAFVTIKVAEYNKEKSSQPVPSQSSSNPAVPNNTPQMALNEPNTDRSGSDYKDFQVSGLDECKEACLKDSNCKAFSFNRSANQCWLKNDVPFRKNDPYFISGVKK